MPPSGILNDKRLLEVITSDSLFFVYIVFINKNAFKRVGYSKKIRIFASSILAAPCRLEWAQLIDK